MDLSATKETILARSTIAADDTAEEFQPTQPLSQHEDEPTEQPLDSSIWGSLIPYDQDMTRINFNTSILNLGRHPTNDVVLKALTISKYHCEIKWDGSDPREPLITVSDLSRNGTYLNGEKIGRGRHCILKDGTEIAFGIRHKIENSYKFRLSSPDIPSAGLRSQYDIVRELGRGAFGVVQKGLCKTDGKIYAIKMIQSGKTHFREALILEKLNHPNICGLKEVFREEGRLSLVLEWVPGGDLYNYILTHGALSECKAKRITFQICDAMAYAHSQGITHRDLKPENILLSTNKRDAHPVVKVADFGLAKAVDGCTVLRSMCGTPGYTAPEIKNRRNKATKETYQNVVDSWSVGVMLFVMLTRHLPSYKHGSIANWDLLEKCNVTRCCVNFVEELLQGLPDKRMTMANTLHHPWLCSLSIAPVKLNISQVNQGLLIPSGGPQGMVKTEAVESTE